jgi:hypothetical protein
LQLALELLQGLLLLNPPSKRTFCAIDGIKVHQQLVLELLEKTHDLPGVHTVSDSRYT